MPAKRTLVEKSGGIVLSVRQALNLLEKKGYRPYLKKYPHSAYVVFFNGREFAKIPSHSPLWHLLNGIADKYQVEVCSGGEEFYIPWTGAQTDLSEIIIMNKP